MPEGRVVRLQEALTWAFTGWSWSNATATLKEVSDVSQREDYPAPGSLYASYALLSELTEEEARARDLAFFARFDALLSDACFRGDIALEGRRARSTQSEPIPSAYFFKPRGFSYFSGNKIDDTPANASVEAILDSGRDGEWEDAIVDREQFLSWFNRSKSEILGEPVFNKPASSADEQPAVPTDEALVPELQKRGSAAAARREWDAELRDVDAGVRVRRTQKALETDYLSRFAIGRDELRSWIKGTGPVGRPRKSPARK